MAAGGAGWAAVGAETGRRNPLLPREEQRRSGGAPKSDLPFAAPLSIPPPAGGPAPERAGGEDHAGFAEEAFRRLDGDPDPVSGSGLARQPASALRPPASPAAEVSVGVRDESLGWVEIRAVSSGGRIHAELAAPSAAAQHVLAANLPQMSEYVRAAEVPLDSLSVAVASGPGGRQGQQDPGRNGPGGQGRADLESVRGGAGRGTAQVAAAAAAAPEPVHRGQISLLA
jgi:hypothetical protein